MGRNRKSTRTIINTPNQAVAAKRLTGDELTNALGDISIFSPNIQAAFDRAGESSVMFSTEIDDSMDEIDLDSNNAEHRRIFAALYGLLSDTRYNDVQVGVNRLVGIPMTQIKSRNNAHGASIYSKRVLFDDNTQGPEVNSYLIMNDTIVIDDTANRMQGMAYAMLRQQIWAARRLSDITGRPVVISTEALSRNYNAGGQTFSGNWSGLHVWPKLGYNFDFSPNSTNAQYAPELVDEIRKRGFTSNTTSALMTERNPQGRLGIDEWRSIVDAALAAKGSQADLSWYGEMKVTDDNDVGLQVLQNYGRRSGLTKSGSQQSSLGITITPEDDNTLRQLWLKFGGTHHGS